MTKEQSTAGEQPNKTEAEIAEDKAQQAQTETHASQDVSTEVYDIAPLKEALAEAKAKAEENWAHYLEAKAETENVRKRASRDVENAHKYALDKFVPELLAIKDTLEMGIKAAENATEIEKFIEGNNLTLKLFDDTLGKFQIFEVNPQGEAFNPDLHQAMSMIESEEHAANTVIEVFQKGYTLNNRLVRPALVVVSQGKKG